MNIFNGKRDLTADAVKKHLKDREKREILCFSTLTSTQNTLKELAIKGKADGCTVIADCQSGGRGREGRSFFSPSGSGIYMSMLFRPSVSAPSLSPQKIIHVTTAAAVAVFEAIESVTGKKAEIKWVNDVFCNGLKVSGILTEGVFNTEGSGYDYIVLGIGVNLYENSFPDEIKGIAGALYSKRPPFLRRKKAKLIAAIIEGVEQYYEMIATNDLSFVEKYKVRSLVIGKRVDIIVDGRVTGSGKAVSLTDDCALNVIKDDGETAILTYGEVRIKLNEKQ